MGTALRRTPAMNDVLRVLRMSSEPVWGLKIVRDTGRPTGTVYPLLERLERAGMVESRWEQGDGRGPRRRLFELTPAGNDFAGEVSEVAARVGVTVGKVVTA